MKRREDLLLYDRGEAPSVNVRHTAESRLECLHVHDHDALVPVFGTKMRGFCLDGGAGCGWLSKGSGGGLQARAAPGRIRQEPGRTRQNQARPGKTRQGARVMNVELTPSVR
jgi:hypothetical protein